MESVILVSSHLIFLVIGAAIAAWCSYLFRAENASTGVAREQAARRLALLEEVAIHTGTVHHLFQTYTSLLIEMARQHQGPSAGQQTELETNSQELAAAITELPAADAKLLLLDEVTLGKVLRLYGSKINSLRKQQASGHRPKEDELKALLKEINTLRDKFFQSLSDRYGRKLH